MPGVAAGERAAEAGTLFGEFGFATELRLGAERGRSDGAWAAGGPRLEERCCQLASLRKCASDLACAPTSKVFARPADLTAAGAVEGRGAVNALLFDMSSLRTSFSSSVFRFMRLGRSCDMSRRVLVEDALVGVRIGCSMARAVVSEKCGIFVSKKLLRFRSLGQKPAEYRRRKVKQLGWRKQLHAHVHVHVGVETKSARVAHAVAACHQGE